MPVACQSCAPECPQALGAQLPLHRGRLSAAAGISPPVAFGDSPLLVEGAFGRSHVSPL